jgi:hypothetical protein
MLATALAKIGYDKASDVREREKRYEALAEAEAAIAAWLEKNG